jgi:hypothetical protein
MLAPAWETSLRASASAFFCSAWFWLLLLATGRWWLEEWCIAYLVGLAAGEGSESRLGRAGGLFKSVSICIYAVVVSLKAVNRWQLTEST